MKGKGGWFLRIMRLGYGGKALVFPADLLTGLRRMRGGCRVGAEGLSL